MPQPDSQQSTSAEKPVRSQRVVRTTVAVVLAFTALVYASGCLYFLDRFWPNTSLGKDDISLMTLDNAARVIDATAENYTIAVEGQGLDFTVTADEMGLAFDAPAVIAISHETVVPWAWPFELWQTHSAGKGLLGTYDARKLEALVMRKVETFNATATMPVNAQIVFDEASAAFVIVPDVIGTTLEDSLVTQAIGLAITDFSAQVCIDEEQLLQPTLVADDERIIDACDALNAMVAVNLDILLDGEVAYHVGPAQLAQWATVDLSNTRAGSFEPQFDTAAFEEWAHALQASFNTVGSERTYTRPDGKVVTVAGGTYGWSTGDVDLAAQVIDYVVNHRQGSIDIPVWSRAARYTGASGVDWGRYCDVDLSEQHARFYDEDGTCIWESDIISGSPGRATPTGVYMCNLKASPCTLTGQIDPATGEPSYITKVAYWMPFVRNSIGLHDATWQYAFGGTRWRDGSGSHGCVNLPYGAAAELYNLIEIGEAVIVHW